MSFGNLYSEFNNRDIATVNGAFSLGAGSFVSNGKWLVGLDFYNSRGTSENDAYTTKFNAITNALFFGYRVVSTESLNLAPFVGVSNTTTSLNMFEKANENPDFTTFNAFEVNNMDFSARLGLQFEVVFKNKMSFGVSTGYDFTLMGETDWEFEGNSSETLISDRQGGFFINILLGGHLKLK